MKKRIFSFKLYLEGLRQTKLIGIMAFVILTIQAIAIPMGKAIDRMSYSYSGVARGVNFTEVNPLLYTMIYIVAPLLALSLFSFLNKRKSSDFYHSIADTRICLFLSFFAAICTWIIGLCTVTTLIGIITNGLFPQYFTLNTINIWLTTFNILAASLYSVSAVTLAMTLTGTLVTNIAVTGLILILPDYMLFMFKEMILSNTYIIPQTSDFGEILPVGFNFMSCNYNYSFTNISNAVLTLILALVLASLALIIFKFRKSESAGHPALNKYLQAGIRITFCMVVCIFACGGIFTISNSIESFDATDMFALVMIYIVALVVYFLYEIITTKKFKTIIKTIPALLIVVVLNIVCVLTMNGIYNSCLSFTPSASEIEYITVDYDDNYVYEISSYLEIKCSDVKLKNDKIKTTISDVLKTNIANVRKGNYYYNYYSEITVTISVNGIKHQRRLLLSDDDLKIVTDALSNNEDYKECFCTLPQASSVSIETYGMGKAISNNDAMRIYNIMRKEVAETSFEEWYTVLNDYSDKASIASFDITVIDNSETYDISVPLYTKFPEAVNEYIKATYNKETTDKVVELLKDPRELDELSIVFYNNIEMSNYYYYYEDDEYDFDSLNKLIECLVPCDSIGADDIYCRVNIYDEYLEKCDEDTNYNEYTIGEYSAIFKFTGDPKDSAS